MFSANTQHYLNATWLMKLRWVAVIGQLVTIVGSVFLFRIQIPMIWAMGTVILLTAFSNLFLTFWFHRWRRFELKASESSTEMPLLNWDLILGLVLVMDMLSLTVLLFTTGGPNNPFCLFFFVNLSLCALMLNRQWAWAINVLTIFCFSGLMFQHQEMPQLNSGLSPILNFRDFTLQHAGMLVSFATCSSVIVYFMTRLTDELRQQQQEIRAAQRLRANSEKIEALGTLAAGTAHELATPLSTIAIVARDVEQAFEEHPPNFPGAKDVIDDVHLIRSQLDRCRGIIDRMASHAGEAIGEPIELVSIAEISNACLDGLIGRERVQVNLAPEAGKEKLKVPLVGLSQAMRGLVQNAIDADPTNQPIVIAVSKKASGEIGKSNVKGDHSSNWVWQIRDQGQGMSEEQLSRVSEPFYTTKPPGKGMGLGVFLARNVLGRLGGSIEIESTLNRGTCVTVTLPA